VERERRKLAAILAADAVGYSRLMGRDESGTLARLREHRKQRFEPSLARHGGRLVKLTGDGVLAEFPSAVDALSAAIEFQQAMAEANSDQPEARQIVFRVGLHLGDLIVDGDDLYGDGVNVAARLEGEASAGGIVLSRTVHEAVEGRLKATFEDLGSLALKNIERPISAFRVHWEPADWRTSATSAAPASSANEPTADMPHTLPAKPSIAVLPFQNMSADPDQEYFADGMVEDITTELSRFHSLFVIARNSTFSYKGKLADVRQVGRELSVRYVLEGSTRRSGDRVRISAQLLEAETGHHIWAERFDRKLDDIFALQEEITRSIVAAIDATIFSVESVKIARKRPESLAEWELLTKARGQIFEVFNPVVRDDVHRTADQILIRNPRCAEAHGMKALAETIWVSVNRPSDTPAVMRRAHEWATRGRELDLWDLYAVSAAGRLLLMNNENASAVLLFKELVDLYPNSALAHTSLSYAEAQTGNGSAALAAAEMALRLNPRDPLKHVLLQNKGMALVAMESYTAAEAVFREAIMLRPRFPQALRGLVVCYVAMGRLDEAKALMKEIIKDNPTLTVSSMLLTRNLSRQVIEAFRAAGMPE
jgi:adenylate cyclase